MNFWEQKYIEDRVREKQSKSLNVPSAIADMIENSSPVCVDTGFALVRRAHIILHSCHQPKDAQEIQKEDIRVC